MLTTDEKYMKQALTQARKAMAIGEVPIGCVIVQDGTIIGRGYNRRNTDHSTLSHAEITAIRKASRRLGDWRLEGCTLYCTLEPCPMCAGAIINARIPRVVYGASDRKCGAVNSVCSLFSMEFNHHPQLESGVREAECGALLTEFFRNLRTELRSRPKWKPGNNQ